MAVLLLKKIWYRQLLFHFAVSQQMIRNATWFRTRFQTLNQAEKEKVRDKMNDPRRNKAENNTDDDRNKATITFDRTDRRVKKFQTVTKAFMIDSSRAKTCRQISLTTFLLKTLELSTFCTITSMPSNRETTLHQLILRIEIALSTKSWSL